LSRVAHKEWAREHPCMTEQKNQWGEFLSVQDFSRYLSIKVATAYSLVEKKEVPHYRIGRLIRFKRSEIDEWMEGNRMESLDLKKAAGKAIRPAGKAKIDADRMVRKAIDEVKEAGYNAPHGKTRPIQGPQKGGGL